MALLGAGLSAPSGVPTFRGTGRFWREYSCLTIASPAAFAREPALVWWYAAHARRCARGARPNGGHVALAGLAGGKGRGYLAVNQNVDGGCSRFFFFLLVSGAFFPDGRFAGLCRRAGHPAENIQEVHGSLFDVKCSDERCGYVEKDNFADPIVPALRIEEGVDISDEKVPLREVAVEDLPHCPECGALLRPDVVWFGEPLAESALARVDSWMGEGKIDLMLVVGTTAVVYPAAGYVHAARARGARVAVFNVEESEESATSNLKEGDWFFRGDASKTLPELLEGVIGSLPEE